MHEAHAYLLIVACVFRFCCYGKISTFWETDGRTSDLIGQSSIRPKPRYTRRTRVCVKAVRHSTRQYNTSTKRHRREFAQTRLVPYHRACFTAFLAVFGGTPAQDLGTPNPTANPVSNGLQ